MITSDWIAIVSTIIAIAAFIYTWKSNTKRYELTEQYRKNLLEWYSETTRILIKLKLMIESECLCDEQKFDLLSTLSAQIELGRFFFPNIDKGDLFGHNKSTAYQGYRHIALEFLVFSYNLFKRSDANKYLLHAEELQRHFTSYIYELLQPVKFNKAIRRHTDVTFKNDLILEEFLEKDPKSYIFYC